MNKTGRGKERGRQADRARGGAVRGRYKRGDERGERVMHGRGAERREWARCMYVQPTQSHGRDSTHTNAKRERERAVRMRTRAHIQTDTHTHMHTHAHTRTFFDFS